MTQPGMTIDEKLCRMALGFIDPALRAAYGISLGDDMTEEDAIRELNDAVKRAAANGVSAHIEADDVLCKFLSALGYTRLVDEWEKIDKLYA